MSIVIARMRIGPQKDSGQPPPPRPNWTFPWWKLLDQWPEWDDVKPPDPPPNPNPPTPAPNPTRVAPEPFPNFRSSMPCVPIQYLYRTGVWSAPADPAVTFLSWSPMLFGGLSINQLESLWPNNNLNLFPGSRLSVRLTADEGKTSRYIDHTVNYFAVVPLTTIEANIPLMVADAQGIAGSSFDYRAIPYYLIGCNNFFMSRWAGADVSLVYTSAGATDPFNATASPYSLSATAPVAANAAYNQYANEVST